MSSPFDSDEAKRFLEEREVQEREFREEERITTLAVVVDRLKAAGFSEEVKVYLYRNDLKNRLLPRRRPDFEPGEAGAKRINSKSLAMQAGSKAVAGRHRQKPIFQTVLKKMRKEIRPSIFGTNRSCG